MTNKTYMCILRNQTGGCEQPSPTDMEAMYAKYQAWQSNFENNILDMGAKLSGEASVVRKTSVADGPFIELKEVVGGYMTITAASIEEAIDVIKASPMVENDGVSIEIREIFTA